jgi:hypothetical protein
MMGSHVLIEAEIGGVVSSPLAKYYPYHTASVGQSG